MRNKLVTKNKVLAKFRDRVYQTKKPNTEIGLQIGYARASTGEQSFGLQVDALRAAGCERIYQEAVSGALAERPVLNELLRNVRAGDVLVIWKLDRLGRSLKHLVGLKRGRS